MKNLGEHSTQNRSARERSRKLNKNKLQISEMFSFYQRLTLFFCCYNRENTGRASSSRCAIFISGNVLAHRVIYFEGEEECATANIGHKIRSPTSESIKLQWTEVFVPFIFSSRFQPRFPPPSTQQFSISHASACLLTLDSSSFLSSESQKQILLSPNNFRALCVCFCFDLGG